MDGFERRRRAGVERRLVGGRGGRLGRVEDGVDVDIGAGGVRRPGSIEGRLVARLVGQRGAGLRVEHGLHERVAADSDDDEAIVDRVADRGVDRLERARRPRVRGREQRRDVAEGQGRDGGASVILGRDFGRAGRGKVVSVRTCRPRRRRASIGRATTIAAKSSVTGHDDGTVAPTTGTGGARRWSRASVTFLTSGAGRMLGPWSRTPDRGAEVGASRRWRWSGRQPRGQRAGSCPWTARRAAWRVSATR